MLVRHEGSYPGSLNNQSARRQIQWSKLDFICRSRFYSPIQLLHELAAIIRMDSEAESPVQSGLKLLDRLGF